MLYEDEYAPFWSVLWRPLRGWKLDLIAARGFKNLSFIGSLIGIWLFKRKPFKFLNTSIKLESKTIKETSTSIGISGMSGMGFFGVKFEHIGLYEHLWLVVATYGAIDHIKIDGEHVKERYNQEQLDAINKTLTKNKFGELVGLNNLVGGEVLKIICEEQNFELHYKKDGKTKILSIRDDKGKIGDIRELVIISKKARLWINDEKR